MTKSLQNVCHFDKLCTFADGKQDCRRRGMIMLCVRKVGTAQSTILLNKKVSEKITDSATENYRSKEQG